MKTKQIALAVLMATVLITSCEKDKPEENDEEVITTMSLSFTPIGGGTTVTYQFNDPDGPGGTAPTQEEIVLAPSKTYNVTVQLLNKTETPVEDITLEVLGEKEAHRFYYEPNAGSGITVAGLDTDGAGVPLGVTSVWTTNAVTTGKVKVTLRHYAGVPPNKAAGDLVNSSKSATDIEVEFNTKVQ